MDTLRFDGRVAVVTGAGRGIGRAHALLLASRGAAVVVNDLGAAGDGTGSDDRPADEVVAEIERAGGQAVANYASVADESGAASIVQSAIDAFGRIDILINNAGIHAPLPFGALTADRFRRQLDVHAMGTIMTTMAAWPHMVAAGYGRIVQTGSSSIYGNVNSTDYGAAKGAVLGFTLNLANEAAAYGICVNCVFPAANTRLAKAGGEAQNRVGEEVLQTYLPEQASAAVVYLAHESCDLNGVVLTAKRGRVARVGTIEAKGYSDPGLTVEDVASRLNDILDLSDASPYPAPSSVAWMRDQVRQLASGR